MLLVHIEKMHRLNKIQILNCQIMFRSIEVHLYNGLIYQCDIVVPLVFVACFVYVSFCCHANTR